MSCNWELAYTILWGIFEPSCMPCGQGISHKITWEDRKYRRRKKKTCHFSDHDREFDSKAQWNVFFEDWPYLLHVCKATLNVVPRAEAAGSVSGAYGSGWELQICKVTSTFSYFSHGYLRPWFCEMLCAEFPPQASADEGVRSFCEVQGPDSGSAHVSGPPVPVKLAVHPLLGMRPNAAILRFCLCFVAKGSRGSPLTL